MKREVTAVRAEGRRGSPRDRRTTIQEWVGLVMHCLAATGCIWVAVPLGAEYEGPIPGHPEQLRPGAPLTPAERALQRQLKGVGRAAWWLHSGLVAEACRRESSTAEVPRR
ncbi:DUF6059 family protein [Streptomyces sp. NPDC004589]|uniref:DUF6059 family protein n=2 Tax=Streptomyces TaxID=1883 RepID=UPI0033A4D634